MPIRPELSSPFTLASSLRICIQAPIYSAPALVPHPDSQQLDSQGVRGQQVKGPGASQLPGYSLLRSRGCPHPATGTCSREWCLGTLWKNLDITLCSIGKNKALPLAKGCWDLGMGLRTQAKKLMGLLEAQTVVSARAKLAGSTVTQREVEATLSRRAPPWVGANSSLPQARTLTSPQSGTRG